jgi:hypothetical protein
MHYARRWRRGLRSTSGIGPARLAVCVISLKKVTLKKSPRDADKFGEGGPGENCRR